MLRARPLRVCVCVCACVCACACAVSGAGYVPGLKKLGYKTTGKKLDHIMAELDLDQNGNVEFTGLGVGFRV